MNEKERNLCEKIEQYKSLAKEKKLSPEQECLLGQVIFQYAQLKRVQIGLEPRSLVELIAQYKRQGLEV